MGTPCPRYTQTGKFRAFFSRDICGIYSSATDIETIATRGELPRTSNVIYPACCRATALFSLLLGVRHTVCFYARLSRFLAVVRLLY